MPDGRPKKTLEDLPADWKAKIIAMGKEGAMDIEMRIGALGHIAHETWDRLLQEEDEFLETVTRAREFSEAWWKGKPAKHLENKDFNTNLFGKVMANKYGWKDKKDFTSDNKPITAIEISYVGTDKATDT